MYEGKGFVAKQKDILVEQGGPTAQGEVNRPGILMDQWEK